MKETEHHQMELEATYPSGAEEWYCPTCGRRFLMQWKPSYNMIVIETGDEHASHSGSSTGMPMWTPEAQPIQDAQPAVEIDEQRLRPWIEWLESVDFESWWKKDLG